MGKEFSEEEILNMMSENETLKKEVAALHVQLQESNNTIASKDEIIADLRKRLATPKTEPSASDKVVKDTAGKKYKVTRDSFIYGKKTYTVAELAEDSKIVDEMVEKKVGFLKEI